MNTYKSILSLLASYGILLLANGLFGTIISIRTKQENFPDSIIGIVLAAYFAGLLISSLISARVIARVGHIRAFAMFASVASAVALAHLFWANPVFWGMLRLISGLCMGGMIIVTEGWLNENATNKNRGTVLSMYMLTTYICAGFAQLIMIVGNPSGFKLFIFVSILFSMALLPILLSKSQAPKPSQPKIPDIRKLIKISPVGMIGSFAVGTINSVYYALIPIYAYSIGLNISETAIFIALGISSGAILQIPLGKLSDKIDRRWVIFISTCLTTTSCYLFYTSSSESILVLYVMAIFYGCSAFSLNPICAAHTNDLTPANERTQTSSGLLMLYGIGAVFGPIVGGILMNSYGASSMFAMSGVVSFSFGLFALYRVVIKPRVKQEKENFLPFAVQSPARKLIFSQKNKNKN